MKRQGKYGFTWDSKAEEWAAWCRSVWDHDNPRQNSARFHEMWVAYNDEAQVELQRPAKIDMAGYYNALPSRPVDPYRAIIWRDEPRKAPLWPFAAIAVVAAVAAVIVWTWG